MMHYAQTRGGRGKGVGRGEKKETGIKIHRDKKKGRHQIKSEGKRDEEKTREKETEY